MVMEIQCTWAPRMLTRIVEYGTRGSCLTAVLVRLTQEMDGAPHRSTDMDRHAWFSILCGIPACKQGALLLVSWADELERAFKQGI